MDIESAIVDLFMKGWPQKDISGVLKVSEKTVSHHVKKKKLRDKREDEYLFEHTSAQQIRELIQHNLTILTKIAAKQKEEIGDDLTVAELEKKLITKGDADGLSKLYAQIKGKELEWDVIVSITRQFMEYLEGMDLKLAQSVWPFANEFLNEKRKRA